MTSRRMEFFIGMMVIGIIAGVFVMTILFGSEKGFFVGSKSGKRLTIQFEKGGGISQNSLVLKNGIKIGRVYSVDLVDDVGDSYVNVAFELDPGYNIYTNEIAKINRTLLGDASIEFVDNPEYVGEVVPIEDSNWLIEGRNTGDLMGTVNNLEGNLADSLQKINAAAEGVTDFMANVNQILGDQNEIELKKERLQSLFAELEGAFSSIRSLASNMNVVVSDPEIVENIRTATAQAPEILGKVSDLTDGAKQFMADANSMGADVRKTLARAETTFDLVDKNLDNVNVFTTSLAENGPQIMTALNESSVEIRSTIVNIRDAVNNIASLAESLDEKLDDPDSPIALLSDAETAKSIRRIIRNAEELSQKLYPILDDARVFSNKVAHKPSSLIWDKTTYKGGASTEGRYGFQSLSPSGGISSPLYRPTPNGSQIRERLRYEPAADEEFMDARTRGAYASAVDELDARARLARANVQPDAYSRTLPTASAPSRFGIFDGLKSRFGAEPSSRAQRARWSLASFWNMLGFNKRDDSDGFAYESYDDDCMGAERYEPGDGVALFAGYEAPYADGFELGQPSYDYFAYESGEEFAAAGSFASDSGVRLAPYEGAVKRVQSDEPRRVGAYGESEVAQPLDFSLAEDYEAEEIEELPQSINRATPRLAPTEPNYDSTFEDDGLPLEFAPPTM